MLFSTLIETLRHSRALLNGEIVIRDSVIAKQIKRSISDPTIKKLSLRLEHQHCLLDIIVGKAGLRYRLVTTFALRAADLNSSDRKIIFEQSRSLRVIPANLAAKAVRFTPSLLSLKFPFILSKIVRFVMDQVVEELVSSSVMKEAEKSGFNITSRIWQLNLNNREWSEHPAFAPINVPFLGVRPLIGGVIVIPRIDLVDGTLRVKLAFHPDIAMRIEALGENGKKIRSIITESAGTLQQYSFSTANKFVTVGKQLNSSVAGKDLNTVIVESRARLKSAVLQRTSKEEPCPEGRHSAIGEILADESALTSDRAVHKAKSVIKVAKKLEEMKGLFSKKVTDGNENEVSDIAESVAKDSNLLSTNEYAGSFLDQEWVAGLELNELLEAEDLFPVLDGIGEVLFSDTMLDYMIG